MLPEHMCATNACLGHAISTVLALLSAAAHRGFPGISARGRLSPLSVPTTHVPAQPTPRCGRGWVPPRAGRMLGPGSKQHQWQLLCSFLPGLFACVGCVPRRTRRRERGRVASPVPPCAVTLLLQRLQDQEVSWGHPTTSPCPAPVPRSRGCQAAAAHWHGGQLPGKKGKAKRD